MAKNNQLFETLNWTIFLFVIVFYFPSYSSGRTMSGNNKINEDSVPRANAERDENQAYDNCMKGGDINNWKTWNLDTMSIFLLKYPKSIYFGQIKRLYDNFNSQRLADSTTKAQSFNANISDKANNHDKDGVKDSLLKNKEEESNNNTQSNSESFQPFSNMKTIDKDDKPDKDELYDQICNEVNGLKMINEMLNREIQIEKESGVVNLSEKYKWGRKKVLVQNQIISDKKEYKKLSGKPWSSKNCESSN